MVDILVEIFISGYFSPTYLKILPFRPNIFEKSSEVAFQALDILRLLMIIGLIYFMSKKVLMLMKGNTGKRHLIIGIVIDLAIVFFFTFAWGLNYWLSDTSSQDVYNQTGFVDYVQRAIWF